VEEKSVPKDNRFSVQDGFGSTNGVYLALKQKIGMQEEKNK
jgi:neutral trehalase